VESVYLAADPDREGEAICYHLQEELDGKKNGPAFFRVMFNEITKTAVKRAFDKPGMVNIHLSASRETLFFVICDKRVKRLPSRPPL